MSLDQVAVQMDAQDLAGEASVDKWRIFQHIREARVKIGREHARSAAVAEERHALRRMRGLRRERLECEQRIDELV